MGPQRLIRAAAVRVARRGPPAGKPSRAEVPSMKFVHAFPD